uniref:Triacylglycerol lipase n=1 Tax=Setaria digitata TaxID=48799 RepID=A0A915PVB7_9BILA
MLLYFLLHFYIARADFTPHFRSFIHNNYGIAIAQALERTDLGDDASFGGKESSEDELRNQAVILIHGSGNKITRVQKMVVHLISKGYKSSEIYGTTWGDGGSTSVGLVDMKCSYVKQIRSMIIAVRQYTGTRVDVIAYGVGSPLARKAILGGDCVDTREILGPPLTELIDTYLSVAGANHGISSCFIPIPVGACNRRTGLHCRSTFLQDINGQTRYEGTFIFSIFSDADEKIGFRGCNTLLSPIRGETGFVKKEFLSHDLTIDKTYEMQRNFIRKQQPV